MTVACPILILSAKPWGGAFCHGQNLTTITAVDLDFSVAGHGAHVGLHKRRLRNSANSEVSRAGFALIARIPLVKSISISADFLSETV